MDVGSKGSYPANALSNFSPHKFVIDGIECSSMEGFLQSLKYSNQDMQKEVCKLIGFAAKRKGANKNWKEKQILYWQGQELKRSSEEYQQLLVRAYKAMAEQSEGFKNALKASGDAVYSHSMGKNKESETVLTEREFCRLLNMCRDLVKENLSK